MGSLLWHRQERIRVVGLIELDLEEVHHHGVHHPRGAERSQQHPTPLDLGLCCLSHHQTAVRSIRRDSNVDFAEQFPILGVPHSDSTDAVEDVELPINELKCCSARRITWRASFQRPMRGWRQTSGHHLG